MPRSLKNHRNRKRFVFTFVCSTHISSYMVSIASLVICCNRCYIHLCGVIGLSLCSYWQLSLSVLHNYENCVSSRPLREYLCFVYAKKFKHCAEINKLFAFAYRAIKLKFIKFYVCVCPSPRSHGPTWDPVAYLQIKNDFVKTELLYHQSKFF